MADKRKLQGEIDRCLKKVQEGVEAFEEIWKKMDATNNANQKEKFEADLKKEIKKLQRLRDQIKAWAVQSDIKDKQVLADNRKLIETQMERFKVIEREAKIKAYSKEGLGATGKVDPKEKEKEEITAWLAQSIRSLNVQVDKLESEVEAITSKKKKYDRDEQDRLETARIWLGKHRFHINKLEAVLRLVDNSALQFDEIHKIHDAVEYYIDCNQDPDFAEDEFVYDELDLEELNAPLRTDLVASSPSESSDIEVLIGTSSSTTSDVRSPSVSSAPSSHSKHKNDDEGGKRRQKQSTSDDTTSFAKSNLTVKIANATAVGASSSNSSSGNNKVPQTPTKTTPSSSTAPSTPVDTPSGRGLSSAAGLGYAQVAGSHQTHPTTSKATQPYVPSTTNSVKVTVSSGSNGLVTLSSTTAPSFSQLSSLSSIASSVISSASAVTTFSLLLGNCESPLPTSTTAATGTVPTLQSFASSNIPLAQSISQGYLPSVTQQQLPAPFKFPQMPNDQQSKQPTPPSQLDTESKRLYPNQMTNGPQNDSSSLLSSLVPPPSDLDPLMLENNSSTLPHQQTDQLSLDMNSLLMQSLRRPMPSSGDQPQQAMVPQSVPTTPPTTSVRLNPLYGVAPLGQTQFSKDQIHRLSMLDAAFRHLPHPSDSERPRTYFPSNPCPTPSYYPIASPAVLNSPEFFSKLDTNSLFFVFYYMEGTKAQFLAAKALKQKSWRFHTKYMMWFQRHEEPKTINEEFEQGTYIYFDYEKWNQRKKEDFKFEYRFLEDHDLS